VLYGLVSFKVVTTSVPSMLLAIMWQLEGVSNVLDSESWHLK
jgi:hypothetical protein